MTALQTKAMLVTLSVSGWTARKLDRNATEEVDRAHNAKDAGRYNKLLVDKAHLDPISQQAAAIRQYHYKMTLPWMDNGARLLPAKLFMEYSTEIRKFTAEYMSRVDHFIQLYDARLVQEARQRLGTLYDPNDYPAGYELRSKFGVTTDVTQVPSGQDFRVDIGEAERARISAEIAERVAERQAAAEREAWLRIREAVSTVEARCSADKARIYDSLIDNVRELARILPGLNVGDNPLLADACSAITERLLVSPDRLRTSATARRRIAEDARVILEMIP